MALASSGALAVMGALCRLVERREFRRVTPTLMSLYYQVRGGQAGVRRYTAIPLWVLPAQAFRGQDAASLVAAHKEAVARAAAARKSRGASSAAAASAGAPRAPGGSHPTPVKAASSSTASAAAGAKRPRPAGPHVKAETDVLKRALAGAAATAAAAAAARSRRWAGSYSVPVRSRHVLLPLGQPSTVADVAASSSSS